MSTQEEIVQQIDLAIGAHSLWKTRLRKAIETGESQYDLDTVRASDQCAFGKWLDENIAELGRFADCAKAKDLHRRFHTCTAEVLGKALAGHPDAAQAAMESGSEFASVSTDLTRTMMNWKKDVRG